MDYNECKKLVDENSYFIGRKMFDLEGKISDDVITSLLISPPEFVREVFQVTRIVGNNLKALLDLKFDTRNDLDVFICSFNEDDLILKKKSLISELKVFGRNIYPNQHKS